MAKIFEYQADVDTSGAQQNLTDLDNKMDQTAQKGSAATGKLKDSVNSLGGPMQNAQGGIKGIGAQLGQLGGPIGAVIQGVKGVIQVFNILIMNPIGLIIAAIATALIALYKAFTSTNDGADKMEQIMAGLGAVVDVIRDRFLKLAGAIGKLFSGDFSGAMEDAKGAISGVGDEIAREAQEAAKLQAELQALEDMEKELIKTRAAQNRQIAAAKLLLEDENASFADRKKALEEVRQSEVSLAKQEEEMARRRYEAIKAQNALSDASDEALQKEAEAYAALQDAMTSSFNTQTRLAKKLEALQKEEEAKQKAAFEEYKKNQEAIKKFTEDLRIESIADENEREKEKLKASFDAKEKELKALAISAAKKKELLKQLNALEKRELQELDDKFAKEKQEKAEADAQKTKEKNEKKAAEELALEQDKIQKKSDAAKLEAYNTITNQEDLEAKLKEIEAQRQADQIASLEAHGKDTTAIRLKMAEDANKAEVDAAKKAAEDKKKIDDEALKAKEANIAAVQGALKGLGELVGQETAAGKTLAIASTIIDTYTGATKAFAQGGIFGYIGAAGVIASGLANVRKIMETKVEGEKGGGAANMPSGGSIGPSVGIVGASIDSGSQAAGALNSAMNNPPKAYVVGQDVTSQQSLDRRISQNATI